VALTDEVSVGLAVRLCVMLGVSVSLGVRLMDALPVDDFERDDVWDGLGAHATNRARTRMPDMGHSQPTNYRPTG